MSRSTSDQVRSEAARLADVVEEVCRRIGDLREAVAHEDGEVPEEMLSWLVEPTVPFYLHGCLGGSLEGFLEQHEDAELVTFNAEWGTAVTCGRQIMPGEAQMDGFFYAVLRKSA